MKTDYAQEVARILNEKRPVDTKFNHIHNTFTVKPGRKYDKVILTTTRYYDNDQCGSYEYIELFVDKNNGDIFKPNGDKPAKKARYNVSTIEGKEEFSNNCTDRGYLYLKKAYVA